MNKSTLTRYFEIDFTRKKRSERKEICTISATATSTSISPLSIIAPVTLPITTEVSKTDENVISSSLGILPTSTISSYIPSMELSGLVAPVPKRPRLVLPVINEEERKRLLEQQPHIASEPTHPTIKADPPCVSACVPPTTFTPTTSCAASPITEAPAEVRCSPSTSVDTSSNSKEDEEPELFVDIESIDNRPEGRDRRRAYIEFYRKVKTARQREPGPILKCALCDSEVMSNDNSIHTHVNQHADAGGFWCKLCGASETDKYRIYEHMRVKHPNNLELFEDRRDIVKLCAVVQECFPRVCPRSKKDISRDFENLLKYIDEKNIRQVKCEQCEASVKATKSALMKHAHSHPVYRCKACKYTSESIKSQEEHQVGLHTVLDPKNMVDYNVCGAADVLARTVQRCFAYILKSADVQAQPQATEEKS
ncbi:zinc finger, C2H2 type [Necator americanus]|uniref:Zinc finger, C2H2 type n=1 Tax=Necator americanus TaxID=51031 RepID=W2SHH3_NECAM|nr:zinc finger, C2H2 type [Necator americanus]ETN69099.1 zinc finger, C2H2 type [Necator americanus]